MIKIKVLLIAAGESRRMGTPKQLLPWGNTTLIEHQIEILNTLKFPISVVLGAHAELIQKKIKDLNIQIFFNEYWHRGMGTSIAFGSKKLNENKENQGILITLIDQPLIKIEHYQQMVSVFKPGNKQIIMSQSEAGLKSAPVLFDKYYFSELMELNGKKGAKDLIKKYQNNVIFITCKSSLEDMDTLEAYERMLKFSNPQS